MEARELHYQLSVLRDVQQVYSGKTIENIIQQMEARVKEVSQIEKASYEIGLCDAYKTIISFLDALEVKEVDLDEEIERFVKSDEFRKASGTIKVTNLLAKHFYELGFKAQKGE